MSVSGPRKGHVQRSRVIGEGMGDDQLGAARRCGRGHVGDRRRGAVYDPHLALEAHEAQQQENLVVTVLQAGRRFRRAEMRRDQAVQLEGRRQQSVDDRELVVGLVLRIGIDDDAGALGCRHGWA
jgi:hypothetical protein